MSIFFISDTHLGHKWCALSRGFESTEAHDNFIIDNWNSAIRKQDIVWLLGDAVFGKANLSLLNRLTGQKRLIMGNHDNYASVDYLQYFKALRGVTQFKGGVLSHIPVHSSQLNRFKFNIHGHLHDTTLADPRYICVSCEQINYTPISYDAIRETHQFA